MYTKAEVSGASKLLEAAAHTEADSGEPTTDMGAPSLLAHTHFQKGKKPQWVGMPVRAVCKQVETAAELVATTTEEQVSAAGAVVAEESLEAVACTKEVAPTAIEHPTEVVVPVAVEAAGREPAAEAVARTAAINIIVAHMPVEAHPSDRINHTKSSHNQAY